MGWKEKHILKAGREVLIKTIFQVIPTYSMSLFKIPKIVCDGRNSALSKYWWGQTRDEKKIHWINWGRLCTSKRKGGMGFRDIHTFNLAMLAKQAWRLLHETPSLFYCVYKARYFPLCSFMDAKLGASQLVVWRSLLQAQEVIREGFIWQVGNGQTIGINTHRWLPRPPTFNNRADKSLKVAGLIDGTTNQWDRVKVHAIFDPGTREDIL